MWQPIETAPKGEAVLVWAEAGNDNFAWGVWPAMLVDNDDGHSPPFWQVFCREGRSIFWGDAVQPTHWMPELEAPIKRAEAEAPALVTPR